MVNATLTLSDFLLARITEDAADACRMAGLHPDGTEDWHADTDGFAVSDRMTRLARRTLADVEVKRQIVANCQRAREAVDRMPMSDAVRSDDPPLRAYWRGQDWTCRVLALPYADHPGYRDAWRP